MKKLLNIGRDKKHSKSSSHSQSQTQNTTRHISDQAQDAQQLKAKKHFPRHSLSISRSSLSLRSNFSKSSLSINEISHNGDFQFNNNDTTIVDKSEIDNMDLTINSETSVATAESLFKPNTNLLNDIGPNESDILNQNLYSPNKGRNIGSVENLLSNSASTKRTSAFPMSKPALRSLVDPDWDTRVFKSNWINKITDDDHDGKLIRAELKGSQLLIYRVPVELSFVKNLTIEPESLDSPVEKLPDEFFQSKSELSVQKEDTINNSSVDVNNFSEFTNSEIVDISTQLENSSLFGSTTLAKNNSVESLKEPETKETTTLYSSKPTSILDLDVTVKELLYKSSTCPHPNLTFDFQTGMILQGDLESICHTILFYPSDSLCDKLIEILPLMNSNLNASLDYFLKYAEYFRNNSNTKITNLEIETMSRRIKRVLDLLQSKFTSFILNNEIFDKCLKLLQYLKNIPVIHSLAPPKVNGINSLNLASSEPNVITVEHLLLSKRKNLKNLIEFEIEEDDNLSLTNLESLSARIFLNLSNNDFLYEINKIDHDFIKCWNAHDDISFLCDNEEINKFNPLHFDPYNKYHYLGRILSYHIFEDKIYSQSAELRAKVLTKWIQLGQLLCDSGNMVSWLGISTVICGLPILRLSETWGFVDKLLIDEVSKKWAPVVFEVKRNEIYDSNNFKILVPRGIGSIYPREDVIPYYGDLSIPKFNDKNNNIKNYCSFIDKFYLSLSKWDTYFNHIINSPDLKSSLSESIDDEDSKNDEICEILKSIIKFNVINGPFSNKQFMKLSLNAEYSYNQENEKWYEKSRSPLFLGSYPSILFIDILPNYHIYDLKLLIGGIGGSNDQILRLLGNDENEVKKNKNGILKIIRDTFNLNSMDFRMNDESIIFKTELIDDDMTSSSRPASILFDSFGTSSTIIKKKRMSVLSSKSFNMNDYINSYNSQLNDNLKDDGASRVEVMVKAATINRLIDLLILTSSIFGTKIKSNDVYKYSEKLGLNDAVIFQMDNELFSRTFFSTYRIFYSTVELIESLKNRFIGSKSASISIEKDLPNEEFPNWCMKINNYNEINWKFVIKIQLGVLESTFELIQNYFNHFFDNIETKIKFDKFLEIIDLTIVEEWPKIINENGFKENDDEIIIIFKKLDDIYKQLRTSFIRQSFTPSIGPISLKFSEELDEIPEGYSIPVEKGGEGEVNKEIFNFMEGIQNEISKLFNPIKADDWIDCFNILQSLVSKSNLSMFKYDSQSIGIDNKLLHISNIFHWIMTLKDDNEILILDKLPIRIKSIFQMYEKFRDFILMEIIDLNINEETRIGKMISILKMIKISRIEMGNNVKLFNDDNLDRSPFIPSFFESILINTMILPVSRFYSKSWIKAGQYFNLGVLKFDSLEDILPNDLKTIEKNLNLSVCPGWILSRIIEIVSFVPNMDVDNTNLINFDKSRFVHTSIMNILDLRKVKMETNSSGFEFLYHLKPFNINIKNIYDHSLMESNGSREEVLDDIFTNLIEEQKMLINIEKQRFELLSSSKRVLKVGTRTVSIGGISDDVKPPIDSILPSVNSTVVSKRNSMKPITTNSTGGTSKFKFGLFKSRPFSINMSNHNIEKRSVNIEELPNIKQINNKMKPNTIIQLKNAKILATYRTSCSFSVNIFNNNGHHNKSSIEYIFQCHNNEEVEEWVYLLNYCQRHWFKSKNLNNGKTMNNMITFGMPLEYICQRDKMEIPLVLEKMMREIEIRGLEEIGIYRKSGSISQIDKIKEIINKFGDFNMENSIVFDIHNITGCIKLFLREIPDPLIPDELIEQFIKIKEFSQSDDRFKIYIKLMNLLPNSSYQLIKRLTQHMVLIEEWKNSNKMTSYNLATIMGGTLVNGVLPKNLNGTFGLMNFICEDLILNFDKVFL